MERPGTRVGPYELHEELGRGGMGSVFRAVDGRTGQAVALKLLGASDERPRRRLLLEARALSRLRHRNVVSLLEAGEEQGRPWLAIELVRGRSLEERLAREGPLPPREAALLVRALATALVHAHREGVLHRDLKPANVLLPDDGGEPKLGDFGLAGFAVELSQSRLTKSGTLLGSPGYWAPEQAAGLASGLGPHTDVYGLGALLYAALTARPPIGGDSLMAILTATERERPAPPGADPDLDRLALRCLEKRPEDRPASVEAVGRELSRWLAGRGSAAPRRTWWIAGGLVVAVVAGGAGALVAWRSGAAPSIPPPPPGSGAAASPGSEVEALLERADLRLVKGELDLADADLARVLELDPGSGEAHALRGVVWSRRGEHRRAIPEYDRALELDPDQAAPILARRGLARSMLGEHQDAVADYDRSLALAPREAAALRNRGGSKDHLGDRPGAIADFSLSLELEPDDVQTRVNRGMCLAREGRLVEAIADYDRVLARAPDHVQALAERGLTRARAGDMEGALPDYERALALDPDCAPALAGRGAVRHQRGDREGALRDLDRALELDPRLLSALANRANLHLLRRSFPLAVADFDRALRLQPGDPIMLRERGAARLGAGDFGGAVADLDEALARDPTSAVALANRGMARRGAGDLEGALADFQAALAIPGLPGLPPEGSEETLRGYVERLRAELAERARTR